MVAAFLMNKSAVVIGIAWEIQKDTEVYDVSYHNYNNIWNDRFDKSSLIAINELEYFKKHYEQIILNR
jgi:hypothetical protein